MLIQARDDLSDVIYKVGPRETPFVYVQKHSKRRLGRMSASIRGNKRRIAKAKFRPMDRLATIHEWRTDVWEGK